MYPFKLWFSLDTCPGVGLQDHMVALYLVFGGPSILFSIVAAPLHIPTNSAHGFPFLQLSSLLNITRGSKIQVKELPTQQTYNTMVFKGETRFLSILFLQVSSS